MAKAGRRGGQMDAFHGSPSPKSLRKHHGGAINLWYFRSPKNACRYTFCGELVFLIAILLEGDELIASYAPATAAVKDARDPHLEAVTRRGEKRLYLGRYDRRPGVAPADDVMAASESESTNVTVVTDVELGKRRFELDNWLFLCAAMNRVSQFPLWEETCAIRDAFNESGEVRLGNLLAMDNRDPAKMLGALAAGLQRGAFCCDTRASLLTRDTFIRPRAD